MPPRIMPFMQFSSPGMCYMFCLCFFFTFSFSGPTMRRAVYWTDLDQIFSIGEGLINRSFILRSLKGCRHCDMLINCFEPLIGVTVVLKAVYTEIKFSCSKILYCWCCREGYTIGSSPHFYTVRTVER